MKMTFDEKKEEIRKNIEELKEDIKILNRNISEFESVLDKVNSFDEMEQYKEMDIEKGLKIILVGGNNNILGEYEIEMNINIANGDLSATPEAIQNYFCF